MEIRKFPTSGLIQFANLFGYQLELPPLSKVVLHAISIIFGANRDFFPCKWRQVDFHLVPGAFLTKNTLFR